MEARAKSVFWVDRHGRGRGILKNGTSFVSPPDDIVLKRDNAAHRKLSS